MTQLGQPYAEMHQIARLRLDIYRWRKTVALTGERLNRITEEIQAFAALFDSLKGEKKAA